MTTATAEPSPAGPAPAEPAGDDHQVAFTHLMVAEWTKLRSVRSTIWSLVLLVILTFGFTILITAVTVATWSKSTGSAHQQIINDPTATILGAGFQFSQLTICVLGVLVMASEYTTGMIRSSLLAVPKRTPMLWAKCIVFALVVFVVAEAVAFPCFFIGAAILHAKVAVSISDPGVLRAVFGAGLYAALLGLFALSIGAVVRHTAGAIAGVIGFVLVLAPLSQLLPGTIGKHVHAYLPTEAGVLIAQTHRTSSDLMGPWQGVGVFCLWVVALLALSAYLLNKRDA